ncbi:MAG: alpha-L-fucosidase [Saprospiraceae bacterium]|jgi:alpha-L-fucosidase|nr:alpha-L-fucosidase [Saprospiraceae bacterium]MBK6815103.1 alpha-L-fucosidase [Saprospiraceae bacterium]MBK7435394.1 alpha-L-fucosidase [Saprospiraceae bacterium]MBK8282182.1 alpha-L-fucosidase [Saprospiraceae bacterium]MBK8510999.1 alpha-L-fucosidase [Saprospiraceae bacterium]
MNISIAKKLLFCLFFCSSYGIMAQHNEYFPDPDTAIQHRLEEWKDLKFGLLMHWGPYSQWGVVESWSICPEDLGWATGARKKGIASDNYFEYVKAYENLKTSFNPTQFNPEKWAAAAKDAGMKYMVFTTKHHDGFSMFDTKYTDYKITDKGTPFSSNPRSNVTKEIFNAFRQQDFWIGAYFSKPDWHSDYYWWKKFPPVDRNANYYIPKHPEQWQKFIDFTHNQIDELVSDYGKVDILWLDGGWVRKTTDEEVQNYLKEVYDGVRWARNPQNQDIDMPRLVKEVRAKQPKLIVVDRAVPGEQQNYLTPEQHIPDEGLPYPWETCMTMAGSWSYVPNDVYKPTNEIIEKLVDIVSKGGNYLLNIGPSPEGEFDDIAYSRLKEIGAWMKINGEAIYNTRMYTVFGEGDRIRYTKSKDGKTTYIFLLDFPKDPISLTKIRFSKNTSIRMLGSNSTLSWKQNDQAVNITVPPSAQSSCDHAWVIKVTN